MVEIRAMKKSEAQEVKTLGKETFEWFEGLFIPEPKDCFVAVIIIRIAFGYIGTLFSNENWHFRVCDGGYIIPFIASFFNGIFLISGNWYPEVYRKEPDFKRSLGFTSLAQWISLLSIILITKTQLGQTEFLRTMAEMSSFIMMISIVPFYPLASFGGKRIFEWNKLLYITAAFISIYIVFF